MRIADVLTKRDTATPAELPAAVNQSVAQQLAAIGKQMSADTKDERQKAASAAVAQLLAYQTQHGDFALREKVGNRHEVLLLDSAAAGDHIAARILEATGKMPPKQAIEDTRGLLRIRAQQAGRLKHVVHRVAKTAGGYALDLGDGNVVMMRGGSYEVEQNPDIAFVRGRGYGTLPHPVRPDSSRAGLTLLINWLALELGVPKKRLLLVAVALIDWLRRDTAFPVLNFYGPAGCGKSTIARCITQLIDPTESGSLVNIRMNEESIAAAAQHRHVLTFDNVSRLSPSEQDLLCICSTGGELMVRKLYTNSDTAILPLHRPVLVTSIQPVATRPDLLSRTVPVEFAPRKARASEAEIQAKFMEVRPALLGALCELLSHCVTEGREGGIMEHNHRMLDLLLLGEKICALAGVPAGTFVRAMDDLRASTGAELAAGDNFITATRRVLEDVSRNAQPGDGMPGYKRWFDGGALAVRLGDESVLVGIRPKALFELSRKYYPLTSPRDSWAPRNEREMTGALLRTIPVFNDIGITVEKREPSRGNTYWEFCLPPATGEA